MTKEDTEALLRSASNVEVTGIVSEAVSTADTIDRNDVELAKEQLKKAIALNDGDTVTLYVQAYLDITAEGVQLRDEESFTLDVTPMSRSVAAHHGM